MGSGVPCFELGGGPLVAVVSWNQVGRIDLTPVTLPESVLLTLSRRRLWYIGGIIHAGTNMSKEAVTLRPKYNSLNQYSLSDMNERCGDLVSRTCLASAKSATSQSARNSLTLFSSLGKAFWTA